MQSESIQKPLGRWTVMLATVAACLALQAPQISRAQPWPLPEKPKRTIAVLVPIALARPIDQVAQEATLRKANVNGKYRTLLRQFAAPEDAIEHGQFHDLGFVNQNERGDLKDLPSGYWVYAAPNWYLWHELAAQSAKPNRSWGPEQITGAPDTTQMGDITTAWASRTPDAQHEWLLLEYTEAVQPIAIKIYESYNPGAISRVTAFALDGQEVEIWAGKDPTGAPPNAVEPAEFQLQFKTGFKTNRLKIYLNSPQVMGWNEIDAVGLIDANEKTQWARSAVASSTYAEPNEAPAVIVGDTIEVEGGLVMDGLVTALPLPSEQRIANLEREVRDLKKLVGDLQKQLEKTDPANDALTFERR